MEVLPSRFLNVVLEEPEKNNGIGVMERSLTPAIRKLPKEEVSDVYSTETNLASRMDYLDLRKRLPRTVLEECIVELASPNKKTYDSVPDYGEDTVTIEPLYGTKSKKRSADERNNNVDIRDNIFNQVEVVYSDDDEPSNVDKTNGNNSWSFGSTADELNAFPLSCKHCPNKYANKGALWQHTIATHSAEKSCQCQLCGRKFYRNCSLALHMKCHSDEQNCRCNVCGKEFSRLSLLERHAKHHSADTPVIGVAATFACKLCRKNFHDETALKVHVSSHGEKYTCEQCNVTFSTKQLLNLHFYIAHRRSGAPFVCKVCKARFANLLELEEHSLSHTFERPRLSCHHCGEVFTQRCTYKKHLLLHTSEKLSCTVCGIDFTQRSSLLRHYKRLHSLNDIPNPSNVVESSELGIAK